MTSTHILPALVGTSILAGCASSVTPLKDDRRFTHSVHVELGLMSMPWWDDPATGTDKALRAARKTCGASSNATAEELNLKRGLAISNVREFRFSCPNSVEEIQ